MVEVDTITKKQFETPFTNSGRPQGRVQWPIDRKMPHGHISFRQKVEAVWWATKGRGFKAKPSLVSKTFTEDAMKLFLEDACKRKLFEKVSVDGTVGYIWLADPTKTGTPAPEPTIAATATATPKSTEETLQKEIAELEAEEARLATELETIKARLLEKRGQLLKIVATARKEKMGEIITEIMSMSSDELTQVATVVDQRLHGDLEAANLVATPTMAPPPPRHLRGDGDGTEPNVPHGAQA